LHELGGSAVPGIRLNALGSSKRVGSNAEAKNANLMKSGERVVDLQS
jgi:hypothetical protein